MIFNKKGAMFGLDARIALAIFGALSVISGAALFSAIENARVVKVANQYTEIAKALEAMHLDLGLSKKSYFTNNLHVCLLEQNNGVVGWNGPYISNFISPKYTCPFTGQTAWIDDPLVMSLQKNHLNFSGIGLYWALGTNNGHALVENMTDYNTNCHTKKCYVAFISMFDLTSTKMNKSDVDNLINKLDNLFDGGDGPDKGKFIYKISGNYQVGIKVIP